MQKWKELYVEFVDIEMAYDKWRVLHECGIDGYLMGMEWAWKLNKYYIQ